MDWYLFLDVRLINTPSSGLFRLSSLIRLFSPPEPNLSELSSLFGLLCLSILSNGVGLLWLQMSPGRLFRRYLVQSHLASLSITLYCIATMKILNPMIYQVSSNRKYLLKSVIYINCY